MENTSPKLKNRLAKNALIHFYKNRYWTEEERDFLREFFDSHDSDRIWKLKMRLLCEENNDMLVASVIADASDEEREFLEEKYRKDESFVRIGMRLSVHPNSLQKWRDKFLAKIASLLEYKLPVEDIFYATK